MDELVGRALEAIGADGDRVVISLPDECPAVRVDAAQLERVLVNLVENALGYSSPSDPVEVRAVVADGEVVISSSTTGPASLATSSSRSSSPSGAASAPASAAPDSAWRSPVGSRA